MANQQGQEMTTDLSPLINEPQTHTIAGRSIDLSPLRIKELPAFSRAIAPIAADLAAGDVLGALMRNVEALTEAAAIAGRVDRDWLGEQTADVLVELATVAIEANADFFTRRVLPQIQQAAKVIGTLMDGQTSSSP